jgi:hypothetical protein
MQIALQSDGYVIYGNNNELFKIDKDRDIVWVKKIPIIRGIMGVFSNGSILLALASDEEVPDPFTTFQLLDRNGNDLSAKLHWSNPAHDAYFRLTSLETDGDSIFYCGCGTKNYYGVDRRWIYKLWKCNYTLDTIWTKEIPVNDINFIKKSKSGNILVGAIDPENRPFNILLDAQGNVIWSCILDKTTKGKLIDGLECKDESFIVVGYTNTTLIAHISKDGKLLKFTQEVLPFNLNSPEGRLSQFYDNLIMTNRNCIVQFDYALSNFNISRLFVNDINNPRISYLSSYAIFSKIDNDSLLCLGSTHDQWFTACIGWNLPPKIQWDHPRINIPPGQVYIDTVRCIDTFPGDSITYNLINEQKAPLILDSLSGIISCIPFSRDTGYYSMKIIARDARFQADTIQFSLSISTKPFSVVYPKAHLSLSQITKPSSFINFNREIQANQVIDLLGREFRSITVINNKKTYPFGVFVKK